MDAKLKKKWVKALLSGEYKQGIGSLKHRGRHCCLGVLQEVAKEDFDFEPIKGQSCYVAEALESNARLDDGYWELAELNDEGVPFEMIAGLINEAL